jgi:hypothetical protein
MKTLRRKKIMAGTTPTPALTREELVTQLTTGSEEYRAFLTQVRDLALDAFSRFGFCGSGLRAFMDSAGISQDSYDYNSRSRSLPRRQPELRLESGIPPGFTAADFSVEGLQGLVAKQKPLDEVKHAVREQAVGAYRDGHIDKVFLDRALQTLGFEPHHVTNRVAFDGAVRLDMPAELTRQQLNEARDRFSAALAAFATEEAARHEGGTALKERGWAEVSQSAMR